MASPRPDCPPCPAPATEAAGAALAAPLPGVRKADIKLGYRCNNRCLHCVIADQRDAALRKLGREDRGSAEFVREMRDSRQRGFTHVVFTGGEPTIRRDLPRLMAAARAMGLRIHVQTNGRLLAYRQLAERLAPFEAVFVVALHGGTAATHDRITQVPGSFAETTAGIANLVALGQRVVGKTVLSRLNVAELPAIAALLVRLGVPAMNFAFPHALGFARLHFDEVVPRYADAVPPLIAALRAHGREARIMVEAVPACLLPDFAEHIVDQAGPSAVEESEHKQLAEPTRDWFAARREMRVKFAGCPQCRHDAQCEGVWREYVERFGTSEFRPVAPR